MDVNCLESYISLAFWNHQKKILIMKKLILFSLLMVATLFVHAQRGGANLEARVQKQVDRLTEQLNLSGDQQTQIYDLFMERQQNRKAGGERNRDLSQEQRAALKAERETAKVAFDNQVATILTPAQFETFQNLPTAGKGKGQNAKKGGKGKGKNVGQGKRGQANKGQANKGQGKKNGANRQKATPEERAQKQTDRLTEQLGLDANQQTAVYDLIASRAATNQKGADLKSLSKEERTALRANKKEEKAAYEAQLANILTPAQLETYQNLPKEKKGKKGKKVKKGKKNNKIKE